MSADTMLNKLNRLRVNAGKPELKSWKASKDKLMDAISDLEKKGFQDVFPGADTTVIPKTDDPEILAALAKAADEEDEKGEKDEDSPKEKPKVTKIKSELARGVPAGNDSTHSRKSLADQRQKERKEKKAEKKIAKGEVDPKKDPEKAERQKKHIEEKREKRKAEGKLKPAKEKSSDEVTVAEVARELGFSPKIARAKLRRHEAKINDLHTKGQDRWTFPKSARKTLVNILSGKK
jgi:hypothetical protein